MLILLICFILEIVALVCYAVKCLVEEAFADPEWLKFDDEPSRRERLEMDNGEFDWGHDVKNYIEEEI